MPRGDVIPRIVERLNLNWGTETHESFTGKGILKKTKLLTNFTAGSTLWYFKIARATSAMFP